MELTSETENLIRQLKRAAQNGDTEEMDRISNKLGDSCDNLDRTVGLWRRVELGCAVQIEVKEMPDFEGDKWGHCKYMTPLFQNCLCACLCVHVDIFFSFIFGAPVRRRPFFDRSEEDMNSIL